MEKPFVVQGEASESEDEDKFDFTDVQSDLKVTHISSNKGIIVVGEASESESESEDAFRKAFFAKGSAIENHLDEDHPDTLQFDTLLHKKLRECNSSLHNKISNHSRQSLLNGIKALNSTNQQLLAIQVQVQDAAISLSKAYENLSKISEQLNSVLATPYIPEINIP